MKPIAKKWRELLALIPGYDAIGTAGDAWFDAKAAQEAIAFIEECLVHVEGDLAGKPFLLEPWQKALVACLFGWKRHDVQGRVVRRYREVLLYVPRKNGKTPLAAAIALYVFFCDGEKGQQDYIAAADREQAGFLFRHLKGMVESLPLLHGKVKIYGGNAAAGQSKSIINESDGSFLRVISAEANNKHGGNPHLVLIDELHAQPNRDLVDVLVSSMASQNRKQGLIIYITTADFSRPSICNEKHDYACKVRDEKIDDPRFLPVIYELEADKDDWTDEETWKRANPNLGVSVSREFLQGEVAKAKEIPGYENSVKRLHFNMKTDADVRWLSSDLWAGGNTKFDPEQLEGRSCFVGLDLANTMDIASAVAVFPPLDEDELWHVLPYFWVPKDIVDKREKANKTSYRAWISSGEMFVTPGDEIDYGAIRRFIRDVLSDKYRIEKVAYDPWNATEFAQNLQEDGLEVVKFQQSISNFNEPCVKLEQLLVGKRIVHAGHRVLAWMAGNVAIHEDGRGYKMPSRKKSTEKIDGIAALLMGLGEAILEPATSDGGIEIWGD